VHSHPKSKAPQYVIGVVHLPVGGNDQKKKEGDFTYVEEKLIVLPQHKDKRKE
jgi:hypothetical protein